MKSGILSWIWITVGLVAGQRSIPHAHPNDLPLSPPQPQTEKTSSRQVLPQDDLSQRLSNPQTPRDPFGQTAKPPVKKEACVALPGIDTIPDTTTRSDLILNCGTEFGGNGIIAVQEVLYGTGKSCQQNAQDWSCIQESTDTSENILRANGLRYHRTVMSPLKVAWCPLPSTHVFVQYECYDKKDLRDACSPLNITSFGAVNLVSPDYANPSVGRVIRAKTCVCNASVPAPAQLRASMIDIDLYRGFGQTCVEELYYGRIGQDFTANYRSIWELLTFATGVCGRSEVPREITYTNKYTFVYSTEDLYLNRNRRGFWYQIGGVTTNGRPMAMTLSCGPFDVVEPPYSGSGKIPSSPVTVKDGSTPLVTTSTTRTATRNTTSTTTTSNPKRTPPEPQTRNHAGTIAGVVIGGLLALVVFAGVVFFCLRRKNAQASRGDPEVKRGYLPSAVPALPPRNSPMKTSIASRTSSCPEYFEPVDDNIYCVPEDVRPQAQYEVLEGMSNPVPEYFEPTGEGSAYENKRTLAEEGSGNAAGAFPDYENSRIAVGNKNSEYCHLESQAMAHTTDYEKMAV